MHHLKRDAQVPAEQEGVFHVNHVVVVLLVLPSDQVRDLDLGLRLFVKPALVPNDFDCQVRFGLVVVGFHNVAERAFAKAFQNLVPVRHVVVFDALVPTFLVVEPRLLALASCVCNLAGCCTNKPHRRE